MFMKQLGDLPKVIDISSTQAVGEQSNYSERSWNESEEHSVKVFVRPQEDDREDESEAIPIEETGLTKTSLLLHNGEFPECGLGPQSSTGFTRMSAKDVRRWELASEEMSKSEETVEDPAPDRRTAIEKLAKHFGALVKYSSDFRNADDSGTAYLMISLIYGSIHLAA